MTNETGSAAFEARLRQVEDQLAIYQLIAAYGPAIDACEYQQSFDLWTEDGVYEVGGLGIYEGRTGLTTMIDGPFHQGVVGGGSAHVGSLPFVIVEGDAAVATNYARLYAHQDGAFTPVRIVASRWHFRRTDKGWLIERRINRLLNGGADARALLAAANKGPGATV
jgi:ketosteroid isomerase-like protein